jgi:hypothetical protein
MSDSSRHNLYAVAEATYGTTPASPAFKTIRHTGTNLALSKSSTVSEEIRADRQITDFRHGTKQTGGDISGELSYGSYDDFFQAALLGAWVAKAAPRTAATISAAAGDNSINDSASGLPILTPGDSVTLSGFTAGSASNNQTMTVVTSTAAKLILTGTVALVTQAAGVSYTVTTNTKKLVPGSTRQSFSILRNFGDIQSANKPWYLYTGQEVGKFSLTIAVNTPVKIAFSFTGKDQPPPATTAPTGSTYGSPTTTGVLDSFSGTISESGTALGVATELTLNLENGIEPRFVVASDTTILPSLGRCNLTGQLTAYFEDSTLVEKFINETVCSIVFTLKDKANNLYRFTVPAIKYTGGQPDTQGKGAITLAMPFQAILDTVTGTNLIIEKNS